MPKKVTFENMPLTLVGRNVPLGASAPGFTALNQENEEITLGSFGSAVKFITFFLSLDTPACDLQLREFNKRAKDLADSPVTAIGISKDLPYAQKRFCDTFNIRNVLLLSDYRSSSFGINYGVLIKEWNLLARGFVIIDRENFLRHFKLVEEIEQQPDFEEAFSALGDVLEAPAGARARPEAQEPPFQQGRSQPLSQDEITRLIPGYPGWELLEGKKLSKLFTFQSFLEAKYFLDALSIIAEEEQHHPSFLLNYNKLRVTITTHSAGGLTGRDFTLARIIDEFER